MKYILNIVGLSLVAVVVLAFFSFGSLGLYINMVLAGAA